MITPLLVVDTHGELWVFLTASSASMWLEAQDVRDGEYRLFDCVGTEYSLSAESDSSAVVVGPAISEDRQSDIVLEVARRFLERVRDSKHMQGRAPDGFNVCDALLPYAR